MAGRRWTTRVRWLTLPLLGFALAQTQPVQMQPTQTPLAPAPAAVPAADASGGSSVSLTRTAKDGSKRLITVLRTGTSDASGIFTACQPLEDDPPGTPTISVFSETGAGGIRVTIDKNVIVAPLAVVSQKEGGDGHIEVSAGTARYLDAAAAAPVTVPAAATPAAAPVPAATTPATPSLTAPASGTPAGAAPNPAASPVTAPTPRNTAVAAVTPAPTTPVPVSSPTSDRLTRCEVEAMASTVPDSVNVTQGKTRLKGSKLVYDDSDGIARIDGPITFARDGASAPLTGSSATIEVNVDDQTTTLVGGVTLKNGARTSSAERVEYDDAANVAILRGTAERPAKTVTADQTLTASVIRYNLDTGSVVAIGPVGGEFQDGQTPGTASPLPANPGDTAPVTPTPGGSPRPPGGS